MKRFTENNSNMRKLKANEELMSALFDYRFVASGALRSLEKQLEKLETGKLTIKHRGPKSTPEYYYSGTNSDGNHKTMEYIPKGSTLPAELVRREYFEAETELLESAVESVNDLLGIIKKISDDESYENIVESKKNLIKPILLSDEEYVDAWLAENRIHFSKMKFDAKFFTENGERVRSKSEKIIADKFKYEGIPYVYEPELVLEYGKTLVPDFVILNVRTGRSYYYEHFGLMNDPDYVTRTLTKIEEYNSHGYWFGKNLLYSFENTITGFNEDTLGKMIAEFLK